uniref:(northern house mosquito) hypothetical protein n=1 Tax=Culex pipiens TaxID=7175 RepID=A0A8D8J3U5_CULPI
MSGSFSLSSPARILSSGLKVPPARIKSTAYEGFCWMDWVKWRMTSIATEPWFSFCRKFSTSLFVGTSPPANPFSSFCAPPLSFATFAFFTFRSFPFSPGPPASTSSFFFAFLTFFPSPPLFTPFSVFAFLPPNGHSPVEFDFRFMAVVVMPVLRHF